MKEIFYEESAVVQDSKKAKTKYNLFKILSIVSYVFAVLWFFIFMMFYELKNFQILGFVIQVLIPLALFIGSGILLGRFKNKLYVDYDYTFVTGSIRISKVIMEIKRKPIIKFDTSNILVLGKYGSETFEKIDKTPGIKKMILTSNQSPAEGKDFYYLHINVDGGNKLLVFECSELFMANILRNSNKTILEKDFKE